MLLFIFPILTIKKPTKRRSTVLEDLLLWILMRFFYTLKEEEKTFINLHRTCKLRQY